MGFSEGANMKPPGEFFYPSGGATLLERLKELIFCNPFAWRREK
jgi:hypothetical protein